jgi:hypothetical protein
MMQHVPKNNWKAKGTSFLILISLLMSCKQIAPIAPAIQVEKPLPPKQPVSVIDVPIHIELKSYFKQADEQVPAKFEGKEQKCEGTSFSYVFERAPLQIKGKGNELQFDIAGKYALKMNYCPQCTDLFDDKGNCVLPRLYASCGVGEPMRKIEISYKTAFDLEPDYTLKSKTTLRDVKPIDKCEVTVFSFDATDELMKQIKTALKSLAGDIDQKVADTDLRKEVEKAWKAMNKPMQVDKYGYLYINPAKISVSEFQLNGSQLDFSLALEAYPKVELQKKTSAPKPLPNLSTYPKHDGFNINMDLLGNYDSLSAILTSELKGKEIIIRKRNRIVIEKAGIYGASNQQLSFEIMFSGRRKGTLYLVGTPVFDVQNQQISFPDLTFDIRTKNALLKSAKWLFSDKITNIVRASTTYDLKPLLKDASKKLETELNRQVDEQTKLTGNLSNILILDIHPLETELLIRANLQGKIKLQME